VRYARNQPLGAPFMTFFYKMLGQLSKQFVKHPLRFAPYAAIPAILSALIRNSYDVNNDDIEKLRQALPAWMRQRGHMMLLPYKDSHGRWQVVDMGYLAPWGQLADIWASSREKFEDQKRRGAESTDISADLNAGLAAAKGATNGFLLGGPVPDVIAMLQTNVDPFTGQPVIDPRDPPATQLEELMSKIWGLAVPPMLADHGAVQQFTNAVRGTVNRRGELGATETQAALRAFGINLYPVDPAASRAANLRGMKHELDDSKQRERELLRDKNLTETQRENLRATWRGIIQRQETAMQKYREASAFSSKLGVQEPEDESDTGP
jgi:hypothetical protein